VFTFYFLSFLGGRGHFDWPIMNVFFEYWALPNRSTSLDPKLQNINTCAPLMAHLFNFYIWELNFGQTICNKIDMLLKCLGEQLGGLGEPFENHMGT